MTGIFDTNIFDSGIFDVPVLDVTASASITQADNASAATAEVSIAAYSAAAQSGDNSTAAGTVGVTASLTATQGGDAIAVTATVTAPDAYVIANLVQASQTSQATGAVLISGEAAGALSTNLLFADAEITVSGASSNAQAGDTAASTGDAYFLTIGTFAVQQGANGVFSAGEVPAAASTLLAQVSNGVIASGLITGWGTLDQIGDENWQGLVPGSPSWVPVSGANGSWTPINAGAP